MTREDMMKDRFDKLLSDCQNTVFESIIGQLLVWEKSYLKIK